MINIYMLSRIQTAFFFHLNYRESYLAFNTEKTRACDCKYLDVQYRHLTAAIHSNTGYGRGTEFSVCNILMYSLILIFNHLKHNPPPNNHSILILSKEHCLYKKL